MATLEERVAVLEEVTRQGREEHQSFAESLEFLTAEVAKLGVYLSSGNGGFTISVKNKRVKFAGSVSFPWLLGIVSGGGGAGWGGCSGHGRDRQTVGIAHYHLLICCFLDLDANIPRERLTSLRLLTKRRNGLFLSSVSSSRQGLKTLPDTRTFCNPGVPGCTLGQKRCGRGTCDRRKNDEGNERPRLACPAPWEIFSRVRHKIVDRSMES